MRLKRLLVVGGIVVGALVLLVVVATFTVGVVARREAARQVAELSARIGRPISYGRLRVSVVPAGATVEQLVVGPDPARPTLAPLLSAERVRVRVALLPALVTLGRTLRATVEVRAPEVTVVRLRDGSLDVHQVLERLRGEPERGPARPAPSKAAPSDNRLAHARLVHAHIERGRLRLVDLPGKGATAEVSQIEATVDDLGVHGRPRLALDAAVLSSARNLVVRARAGELETLDRPPLLETLKLELSPVDLTPLSPLIAFAVPGFERGLAQAHLDVDGRGPRAHGEARVTGARLHGGRPFDAVLAVDLDGDPRAGNVKLRSFRLGIADMALVARGEAHDLRRAPRIEQLVVESQRLDFTRLRGYVPALGRTAVRLDGPASLRVTAGGTQAAAQPIAVTLDLTPTRVEGEAARKPAGTPLVLDADGRLLRDRVELTRARLTIATEHVDVTGSVRDRAAPLLDLVVSADKFALQALAPFLPAMGKLPPAELTARAHVTGHPQRDDLRVEVTPLVVTGPPGRADGTVTFQRGVLRADRLVANAYGGTLTADGSELVLGELTRPLHAKGRVDHVDLDALLGSFGRTGAVAGHLSATFDLRGRAQGGDVLRRTLAGTVSGTLSDGRLLALDLDRAIAGVLATRLPVRVTPERVGRGTPLGDVRLELAVGDGAARLARPLVARTPGGPLELDGRVFLDGRLDLVGTYALSPEAVGALFANRVRLGEAIPLSLRLGGELHHPTLAIANLGATVTAIAGALTKAGASDLLRGRGFDVSTLKNWLGR